MIIQIATTVVFAAASLATIATIAAGPAAAARRTVVVKQPPPDSEPRRCVRVLGCAPERARQQALRVITGRERRFPPTVDAKGYGPITEPELRKGCLARFSQG